VPLVVAFARLVQRRLSVLVAQIRIGSVAQKDFGDGWAAETSRLDQ
jgi:hypothetical protein